MRHCPKASAAAAASTRIDDRRQRLPQSRRYEAIHPLHAMDPFEALAEPARRRILDILASGEHTAGQIATSSGTSSASAAPPSRSTSATLRDARLVDVRGDLQWRWYSLDVDGHRCAREVPSPTIRREVRTADRTGMPSSAARHDPLANSALSRFAGKGPGRPTATRPARTTQIPSPPTGDAIPTRRLGIDDGVA